MLQVTEHAVVSGDEITAVVAFETFLDLLEVPASWMGAFFPALVKLSVETASNTQLELNTREQALQVRHCAAVCANDFVRYPCGHSFLSSKPLPLNTRVSKKQNFGRSEPYLVTGVFVTRMECEGSGGAGRGSRNCVARGRWLPLGETGGKINVMLGW